jgi:hypothetical protein
MKTKSVFLVMAAVSALWGLVCVGCKVSTGDPHPNSVTTAGQSGYGRIQVIAQEEAATRTARTVFPAAVFDRFTYTFIKAGETSGTVKSPGNDGYFSLEVGSYTVAVSAYMGEAEPYTLAASGVSAAFTVEQGDNQAVVVALAAVAEGQGKFSYCITYPPDAVGVVTLYSWPGMVDMGLAPSHVYEYNGVTEWVELETGTYLLTVQVTLGNRYAGFSEVVHIIPGLTTYYEKELVEDDFIAIPTVNGSVKFEFFWVDQHGNLITTSGNKAAIAVGETLAITAQSTGYTVKQWHLNGVDSGQSGEIFYFCSETAGKHSVGLFVEKNGKLYNSNIVITVEGTTGPQGGEPPTRTVTIDMYDSLGDGWNGNSALKINVNGITIANNVKVSITNSQNTPKGQRYTNTYTFPVTTGDFVQMYWVAGNSQGDISFIVYYTDTPPNPAFTNDNKGATSWSGTNALLYRIRGYASDGLVGVVDGTLLGSFTIL